MTAPFPHTALAALAVATALAGAGARPAPAAAAMPRVRTTCARQTRVLSTPGGLVVGFLARGAPVIVLRRTVNRYWTEVRAVHSLVGWIHTRDLC
jgi:hypothetical protein